MWVLICTVFGLLVGIAIASMFPQGKGIPDVRPIFYGFIFGPFLGFFCGCFIEVSNFCRADQKRRLRIILASFVSTIVVSSPLWLDRFDEAFLKWEQNFIQGSDQTVQRRFFTIGRGIGTTVGYIGKDHEGNLFVTSLNVGTKSMEVNGINVWRVAKLSPDGILDLAFSKHLESSCKGMFSSPLMMLKELPDGQYLMGSSVLLQLFKISLDGTQVADGSQLDQNGLLCKAYSEHVEHYNTDNDDEIMAKVRTLRHISFKGDVLTVLKLDNGSFILGGDFVAKAGGKTWINIIKILPNGDPDMSFEVRTHLI